MCCHLKAFTADRFWIVEQTKAGHAVNFRGHFIDNSTLCFLLVPTYWCALAK